MPTYSKRIDNKEALTNNVFRLFTDAVGGSAEEFANTLYARYTVESFFYADDFNYFSIVQYFQEVVIPHKIAVYQAGLEMSRQPWFKEDKEQFLENLWLHDLSKFSANESYGYCFNDFSSKTPSVMFERAWHHHKANNPHHPEYWISVNKGGKATVMPMPLIYVAEMVADWIGAGKTYGSSLEEWLPKNLNNFCFHHETRDLLKGILEAMGFHIGMRDHALSVEGYTKPN